MCVFYDSRLNLLNHLRRTQTKPTVRNEEARQRCRVLLVETHCRLTFIAVLTCTQKRVYYILSNDLCKVIEILIYGRKKRPFTGNPAAKHPKHSKLAITDIREKPVNFFCCLTQASTLVSAITLLTQVPLQKFPFLFIIIIPCTELYIYILVYCLSHLLILS